MKKGPIGAESLKTKAEEPGLYPEEGAPRIGFPTPGYRKKKAKEIPNKVQFTRKNAHTRGKMRKGGTKRAIQGGQRSTVGGEEISDKREKWKQ